MEITMFVSAVTEVKADKFRLIPLSKNIKSFLRSKNAKWLEITEENPVLKHLNYSRVSQT